MRRTVLALIVACLAAQAIVGQTADASALAREGHSLYKQGKLGEALLKFEEAVKKGASGGELFYQMGYCFKAVRRDALSSREYMTKAVPLLEALPENDPRRYYYLSAIYTNELNESAKGQEAARRSVELAEKGAFKSSRDGEVLFQIARTYSLAAQSDKAVGWYEKAVAALEADRSANKQYMASALQFLAQHAQNRQEHAKAASWYRKLLELEPERRQDRMAAAHLMVKAGMHQEAIETLRGFTDDEMVTQSNYIIRVLTRYRELGSPPLPPEAGSLDDAGLQEAIGKAAVKLSEARKKEDEANKADEEAERPYTWRTTKSGKRIKVPRPYTIPPDEEILPKDPNHPTAEELDRMAGVQRDPPKPIPPLLPERIASEKEFFALLLEYLRRGGSVRDLALTRGFATLVFR